MGIWEEGKGIRRKDQERERELGSGMAERRLVRKSEGKRMGGK